MQYYNSQRYHEALNC
ncbi:hypothetical protein ACQ1QB_10010 [Ornithobacterium rhinotracheale]